MNSDAITSPSSSNYVMGRTSEEYERLRRREGVVVLRLCAGPWPGRDRVLAIRR